MVGFYDLALGCFMKNKLLTIILAQFLPIITFDAEARVEAGATPDVCPSDITMDQLKSINEHGNITVGRHVLNGVDRAHIETITPKSYHPSSLTAIAHLRGTETREGKLICHYGYKTTLGNIGSKFSENVLGTAKEALNEKYDYNFTLEVNLSAHVSQSHSPLDAKEPPQLSTHHASASPLAESTKVHPDVVTPSMTEEGHEQAATSSPLEHSLVPDTAHESTVSNKPETIVITKEEMDKDLTLKDHLSTLGLIGNLKISEFIVDRRYEFIDNDAHAKKATTNPLDMVKMKQSYEYVKGWFERKRQER